MAVHLLDATFELFRNYYVQPSAKAPDGAQVGAVRGLLSSTFALLRDPEVTHLAAATDHVIESFRNELFAGYKTGAGIPADLWAQFPLAEDALRALGVVVWPMVEFEADDALASAAHRFAAADRVVILSPDKDLAQCVRGSRVVMRDRMRAITYGEAEVRAKFGVPPASIPDWLALVGDTADGIPGIPGWGPKSAAAVLAAYEHLDAIPDDPRAWRVGVRGAARLAAALAERRDAVRLYRTLATLRVDVPLSESLDDLRWRGAPPAFAEFCARCGFDALLDRVPPPARN
ncbi:MAG: 5'-3' exonuclease H3TH domain-containing protein [Candidatus Binatia bacterium]